MSATPYIVSGAATDAAPVGEPPSAAVAEHGDRQPWFIAASRVLECIAGDANSLAFVIGTAVQGCDRNTGHLLIAAEALAQRVGQLADETIKRLGGIECVGTAPLAWHRPSCESAPSALDALQSQRETQSRGRSS